MPESENITKMEWMPYNTTHLFIRKCWYNMMVIFKDMTYHIETIYYQIIT